MGDPRAIKKKFDKPKHPWKSDRLEEERRILKEYGLKNKRELWRVETTLRNYRRQARSLLAKMTEQAKVEERQLLDKLGRLNVVKDDATLDDVLALKIEDLLDRRLQSMVYKKGLANTQKQARQFIVHGHITVAGKKVTAPSYIVKKDEEDKIAYADKTTVNAQVVAKEAV
jgi:small subunit ribosomal protein S4